MIDDCCFSESANVQSLINKFELMAQANAASNASRTRAESSTTAPQKPVDNQISRARTQSEPVQKLEKTPESVVKHNTLTVKTLESDDEDNIKTLNPYEDESDMGSTMCYVNCYSAMPRSPSSFSTASTGSLDSLLSSLDMFLPELLQASSENIKRTKPLVAPKLTHPALYRRSSLSSRSPSTTSKGVVPAATNLRRSSLYTKAAAPAPSVIPRPRRSSLSTTSTPPTSKSARRFSVSTHGSPPMMTASPRTHWSDSAPVSRYMDYDQSSRFAVTKARNLERRRQLEERNRNMAADKAKQLNSRTTRRPQTPERQGRLDQVRSRLFDFQSDPRWSSAAKEQPGSTRPKPTTVRSRPSSAASRARV